MGPLYPIVHMLIVLPFWVMIDGFQKLSRFLSRKGYKWDAALYGLIIALSFLAIYLFLIGYR